MTNIPEAKTLPYPVWTTSSPGRDVVAFKANFVPRLNIYYASQLSSNHTKPTYVQERGEAISLSSPCRNFHLKLKFAQTAGGLL